VLSWNARSIRNKLIELREHLQSHFYHLVLVQETWLDHKISIKIPDFSCVRGDHLSNSQLPHGGVLIFIHKSVPFKQINITRLDFSDSVFVRVHLNAQEILFGSVYCSPSLKPAERKSDYEKLVTRPGPFVLGGDFNAKHKSWNNVKNDRSGSHLRKICDDNLCDVSFTDKPTAIPSIGPPSFLDLVISKHVVGISKPQAVNELSSDHLPIVFELPFNMTVNKELFLSNYAKADWKKFRGSFSRDIETFTECSSFSLNSQHDIDLGIVKFHELINKASKVSIPRKKRFIYRYAFSQKIKNLISERNFFRRHVSRYPNLKSEVNELNRQIKNEIKVFTQFNWNDKLATLDTNDNSLYRFAKIFKRKNSAIPPLKNTVTDNLVHADNEKAELIAVSFQKAHEIDYTPTCHSDNVKKSVDSIKISNLDFPECEKTSSDELKSFILRLKTNKAPGYDEIHSAVIKNLPSSAISFLADTFNACLRLGYFPLDWKVGKIIPIAKPGKDSSLPGSYRPITLLPIIGKLFEKIILDRLLEFEEDHPILKSQQFGFRSKHSTTQQILRITETVSIRFNEDKSTAMTLLDIEKAFDAVWHDALRHKIVSYGFPNYLVKIISSFLKDRESFVAIGKSSSNKFPIPAGVPQGSPLSPYLFNLFINDIPIPKHCKIAIYADDTALLSSIKNYELSELIKRMEIGLKEIESHFLSWKIKLNSAKTETILFTQSTIMRRESNTQKIMFNGNALEWLPKVKYLGVVLDAKLLMKQNIDNNIVKARKASGILFPLLKKNSSVALKSKITLYRSYIRPILTYACPVFANTAKTHIRKLQIAQNKNLRMVLSAPFRTHIHLLHSKTRIPKIETFIAKLTETFYKKSARSVNGLVKRLGVYSSRSLPSRLKHKLPRPSL
jgi:hypothetical protein